MSTTSTSRKGTALSSPQLLDTDASPIASASPTSAAHAGGTGALHERLRIRHREAIEAFRLNARAYNREVDVAQQQRVKGLHAALLESHATTASLLAEEQQRLTKRQSEAAAQNKSIQSCDADAVMPVCSDVYHCSTADDDGRAQAMTLMQQNRLHLAKRFIELRAQYRTRMEILELSFDEITKTEEVRRTHIKKEVQDLMSSLTRIAVTSTTESQVLAQRILHHTNEQLGQNFLAMQTMATRLRQRELLKHQQYQRSLCVVYRDTQMNMACQHLVWGMSVFQSALFRRPEGRTQSVHAAGKLIAEIRSEADGLVRGLSEVVDSLDVAEPSTTTAEVQVCGGSSANGWLRCFQPNVHITDLFTGEDPRAVLEEWQMRANVLVRHCRARCDELIVRVKADEDARARVATALAARILEDLDTIAHPLSDEAVLLHQASLWYRELDNREACAVSLHGAAPEVDETLLPLLSDNEKVFAMKQSTVQSSLWARCVPTIEQEGQWFVHVVSRNFRRGYTNFISDAVTSTTSMLACLEGATEALLTSMQALLGTLRRLYAEWHEKERDYQDEVAALERQLRSLEDEVRLGETPALAEERYITALACLQSIADAHTRYFEAVRSRVANATANVMEAGQGCLSELSRQVGLAWVALESCEEVEPVWTPTQEEMSWSPASGSPQRGAGSRFGFPTEVGSTSPLLSEKSGSGDLPVVELPRWSARDGEEFVVQSIAFRFPCITARSGGAGADGGDEQGDKDEGDGIAMVPDGNVTPGMAYRQFYLRLLPELQSTAENEKLFLPEERKTEWSEQLRRALMEWGLALQRNAWSNWRLYTASLQGDVQHRVAEVLRYHRRRPATLQANVYEARVRELADTKNRADKTLSRIAERVSVAQTQKHIFLSQPSHSASDDALIQERESLLVKLRGAMSANAIRAIVNRHEALCTQYSTILADRCAEATQNLAKAQADIEGDCAQLLYDRAHELSGGDAPADLPVDDPVLTRVVQLRAEVKETLNQSLEAVEQQRLVRAEEVRLWKVEWTRTVEQSTAEMAAFHTVQEGLTRLKTQVQTLLTTATTEETALAEKVAKLAQEVATASSTSAIDLPAAIRAAMREDPSAAAAATTVGGIPFTVEQMEEAATHNLEVVQAAQRERISGASACAMLSALDELRMPLYTRGCRLALLARTIEMWRVPSMNYVLPLALGEEVQDTARLQMGSRGGTSKAARHAKTNAITAAATAAAGHTLVPLTSFTAYDEQVALWAAQVQSDAELVMQRHYSAYAGALSRRLPGMEGNSVDDFNAAVAALCQAQQDRIRTYMKKAGPVYRQRVQELWNALQGTPALLVSTLRWEAMNAMLERVEAVLRPWLHFAAQSSAQWRAHQSAVKLSFAQQSNNAVLATLTNAEATRSEISDVALQQTWARSLREVQDEAGLHVARCWTALHSYAHVLKGIVTPQHLTLTTEVVEGGHHRGLRHLLELRAQHERAAGAMEGTGNQKKEPRMVEVAPQHRQENSGPTAPVAGKRHANAVAPPVVESAPLTPLAQWSELELPGLPLNSCAPLTQYNAQHPLSAVPPPLAATPYVPVAAAQVGDGKSTQGVGNRHASRMLPAAALPNTGGRRGQTSAPAIDVRATAISAAAVAELSAPLLVPRAPLVLECVQLLRSLVQSVSAQGNEAASMLNEAFEFYERQETQWRQTWALTLKDL